MEWFADLGVFCCGALFGVEVALKYMPLLLLLLEFLGDF